MTKRQRQWTVQRHLRPTPDGWHRWDRAYQLLMHWATEQRDSILRGTPSVAACAHAVRGHWGSENCVQGVLDVTFKEDRSRVRRGNAPQHFAGVRHIALNLLRQEPSRGSINTQRFRAALDERYLLNVLQP